MGELSEISRRGAHFSRVDPKPQFGERPPWRHLALSGLLVAGLILMSSWLFRG